MMAGFGVQHPPDSVFTFARNDRSRWAGIRTIGTWEDLQVYSLDYGPKLTVVHVGSQTTIPMMFTETKTYEKR